MRQNRTALGWLVLPTGVPAPDGAVIFSPGSEANDRTGCQIKTLSGDELGKLEVQFRPHMDEDTDYARLLRWSLLTADERPVDPASYADMVKAPRARIEKKDHDFVIGANVTIDIRSTGTTTGQTESLQLPAVAIECKTYLDKTMLEGSSTTAEQIKIRTPNAIYIVVMEWLKLTEDVNLKKYKVDQIYVLRKQKNTDREYRYLPDYEKKPISAEVVIHLYETVREHLTKPWIGGLRHGLDRGYLL